MRPEPRKIPSVLAALALLALGAAAVVAQEGGEPASSPGAAPATPAGAAAADTVAPADSAAPAEAAPVDSAAIDSLKMAEDRANATVVEQKDVGMWQKFANSGAVEFFLKGGIFMWPILLLAIMGLAITLERFWTLSRARTNVRDLMAKVIAALRSEGVDAAIQVCETTRGPIPAILHAGLRRSAIGVDATEKSIENAGVVELSFLERGLLWLVTVSNLAPLLGFLGTVSGMINAFDAIAAADQVNAKVVASGISEALITTLAGLVVAIPVSMAHNSFVAQIDKFVIEMQESSADLIETLVDLGVKRAGETS
jgi:biopolymer transport protein ExbB